MLSILTALFVTFLVVIDYRTSEYGGAFILTRIALQAQVLWSSLNLNTFPFVPNESLVALGNFQSSADFISYKMLPTYLYEYYAENGTTLSGFMPGFYIIFFGYFGAAMLHAFLSFIAGYITGILISAIRSKAFFTSFLWLKIYLGIIFSWYALIFSSLASWVFVFGLFLIFLMYFFKPIPSALKNDEPK